MKRVTEIEARFITNDPSGKVPGDKQHQDLIPKPLDVGEPPEVLHRWISNYNKWVSHCYPSKITSWAWNKEKLEGKLDNAWWKEIR